MRIGVDATCWGNRRGFGRFTRELLKAILAIDEKNEYTFFMDEETAAENEFPENAKIVIGRTDASPSKAASANGNRSIRDLWTMSRTVLNQKVDLFFFPTVYSYFPILNRARIILAIHDVIADNHATLIFPNSKSKLFWKLKQRTAILQSDLILTVSEFSKNQIVTSLGISDSRMRVINEGASEIFQPVDVKADFEEVLNKFSLRGEDKFLLYVGGISPHKNLANLISAFALVRNGSHMKVKLVLVGDYKDDPFLSAYPSLKKLAVKLGLEDSIVFTGFVPDEELLILYNAAALLAFPSFEEGFGLPAIEAMSCGTPVVASNAGSLPEVLGPAGILFDPHDQTEIAGAIERVLDDHELRKTLSEESLRRSKLFRWKKAAQDMINVFEELI